MRHSVANSLILISWAGCADIAVVSLDAFLVDGRIPDLPLRAISISAKTDF
jgi:hypothetical protein